MYRFPKQGLYAITQTDNRSASEILEAVEAVLQGGALAVQYRDKQFDKQAIEIETLARRLLTLCHAYQVPLLINDNAHLAAKIGADGVHLGKDDGDIASARALLGHQAIIGVSCYNSLERALASQAQGANYIAFGRFYPSNSKPLAEPAQLQTLQKAKQLIDLPIVAIGGILPSNGKALVNAGADVLAVIGGLFDCSPEHSEECAKVYLDLFV